MPKPQLQWAERVSILFLLSALRRSLTYGIAVSRRRCRSNVVSAAASTSSSDVTQIAGRRGRRIGTSTTKDADVGNQ